MPIIPTTDLPRKFARKLLSFGIVAKLCTGVPFLEELRNQICDICVERKERRISPMIPPGPEVQCLRLRIPATCRGGVPGGQPGPSRVGGPNLCQPSSTLTTNNRRTVFRHLPVRHYDTWLYATLDGSELSCTVA